MGLEVTSCCHAACMILDIQEKRNIKASLYVIKVLKLNLLRALLSNEKHLAVWKQADAQINFSLLIK